MRTRHAITVINKAGFKMLAFANRGTHIYDDPYEAHAMLHALYATNTREKLAEIFGPNFTTLAVTAVECHDSGDAMRIYYDGYSPEHDHVSPEADKPFLVSALASLKEGPK